MDFLEVIDKTHVFVCNPIVLADVIVMTEVDIIKPVSYTHLDVYKRQRV